MIDLPFRSSRVTRRICRFYHACRGTAALVVVILGFVVAISTLQAEPYEQAFLDDKRHSRQSFLRSTDSRSRLAKDPGGPVLQTSDERLGRVKQLDKNTLNTLNRNSQRPVRAIVLFATKRSGSTLLGEFFNQNRECFYLFEPLFPYTRYCDTLREERIALLKKFVECNFSDVSKEYQEAFRLTNHTDENSNCVANNLCFSNRCKFLLYRYAAACKDKTGRVDFNGMTRFVADSYDCGYPLKSNILSSLCSAADFVVYKIIRICHLSDLEPLLSIPGLGIIHLVRDPRGILASRLQLDNDELTRDNLEENARKLCTEMVGNINYANSREHQDFKWGSAKYMRIRYEDLALNPLKSAYSIYSFLRRELPTSVKMWITNSFLANNNRHKASNDPYGTVKNVYQSINSWRKRLTLEQAFLIQKYCNESMAQLNYNDITSIHEMHDFNITFW